MVAVLEASRNDLTRENVMKHAAGLNNLAVDIDGRVVFLHPSQPLLVLGRVLPMPMAP
jgi:hypothetical protein